MQAGRCLFICAHTPKQELAGKTMNSAVAAAFRADRYLALGPNGVADFAFSFCNAS